MPSQYKFVTNSKTALRLIRPLQGQTYCIAINYNIKIERLADLWFFRTKVDVPSNETATPATLRHTSSSCSSPMMQQTLLHAAGILLVAVAVLPSSSAYVLAPASAWSRKATLSRFAAATGTKTMPLRPTLLKMSDAMDSNDKENGADSETPALVPPPSTDFGFKTNLLPGSSAPTNADFLTELVLGKMPKNNDGSLLDGNANSEPVSVPVGGDTVSTCPESLCACVSRQLCVVCPEITFPDSVSFTLHEHDVCRSRTQFRYRLN
eukprot:2318227-Rhodomonas_salina.8